MTEIERLARRIITRIKGHPSYKQGDHLFIELGDRKLYYYDGDDGGDFRIDYFILKGWTKDHDIKLRICGLHWQLSIERETLDSLDVALVDFDLKDWLIEMDEATKADSLTRAHEVSVDKVLADDYDVNVDRPANEGDLTR